MIIKNISTSISVNRRAKENHVVVSMPNDKRRRIRKEIFIDPALADYGKCKWAKVEIADTISRRSEFTEQVSVDSKLTTIRNLCKNIENVVGHNKTSSTELSVLSITQPASNQAKVIELANHSSGIIFTGMLISSLTPRIALLPVSCEK